METRPTPAADAPAASKKYHALIMLWLLAWVGSMVAVSKAEARGVFDSDALSMLAIALHTLIGVGVIVVYMKFLQELDELQRRIQLNALALAMGVGLVGSFTYSLLVQAAFVQDPEMEVLIMLMSGAYTVGLLLGRRQYQ